MVLRTRPDRHRKVSRHWEALLARQRQMAKMPLFRPNWQRPELIYDAAHSDASLHSGNRGIYKLPRTMTCHHQHTVTADDTIIKVELLWITSKAGEAKGASIRARISVDAQ